MAEPITRIHGLTIPYGMHKQKVNPSTIHGKRPRGSMAVKPTQLPIQVDQFDPRTKSITQTIGVIPDQFFDTAPSEGAPEVYLIIGLDTEYVTPQAQRVNEDMIKKNEVLSYQYHVVCSSGSQWNGIHYPVLGSRLTLAQFVLLALSKGHSLGLLPDRCPGQVYLIGHFNRAVSCPV